ncbi:MAG: methylated-DNA--[protein]-cysteine S-methyltransferase [Gammaproteobacteria bacterium]|jgi:AraC family transcriptional regulator of adaptative response/methylated-DNA-[protein]-cysteine methyltransferase
MDTDYARIEAAIRFIRENLASQPTLDEVAAHAGLSPHHFQRLFRRWAGLSPKRYLEHLTVERAKPLLRARASVLETGYAVGLSSPSRLHEQFVTVEATSPGEYKRAWAGVEIRYGVTPGPFGDMLIAHTRRGICLLAFVDDETSVGELERLRHLYGLARLQRDPAAARRVAEAVFAGQGKDPYPVQLGVRGTNFQVSVWRALLRIPPGAVASYSAVAKAIGRPAAVRAVAGAVAANPVHYLIPCHRVLRADGSLGGYRAGPQTKQKLLDWEASSLQDHAGGVEVPAGSTQPR